MAARLFAPSAVILGAGLAYSHSAGHRAVFRPLLCEAPSAWDRSHPWNWSLRKKQMAPRPANEPMFNPLLYRQFSTGSMVGLAAGLLVARFGKLLCLVVGAAMMVIEVRGTPAARARSR